MSPRVSIAPSRSRRLMQPDPLVQSACEHLLSAELGVGDDRIALKVMMERQGMLGAVDAAACRVAGEMLRSKASISRFIQQPTSLQDRRLREAVAGFLALTAECGLAEDIRNSRLLGAGYMLLLRLDDVLSPHIEDMRRYGRQAS